MPNNKKQPLLLALLLALSLPSGQLWASNADSTQNVPRQLGVMVSLPQLFSEQLRLDFEIFSKRQNTTGLFSKQSFTIAPRYYHNCYWGTGNIENKSTFGLGLELQHKLYFNDYDQQNKDSHFYFGYGAGLNYLHTQGDLTQEILSESVHINQKYVRYHSFATIGMTANISRVVIDGYLGMGYKYTHRLNEIQGQRPLDENILKPAYSGIYPVMNLKVGVLLFGNTKNQSLKSSF